MIEYDRLGNYDEDAKATGPGVKLLIDWVLKSFCQLNSSGGVQLGNSKKNIGEAH